MARVGRFAPPASRPAPESAGVRESAAVGATAAPSLISESAPDSQSALSLVEVSVQVEGKALLEKVSLDFHAGEVTAVIGPNGAGKSTLLDVAAGAMRPTQGSVWLGPEPAAGVRAAQAARLRAMMPQDSQVAFAFTVEEVVRMGRTPWRKASRTIRKARQGSVLQTAQANLAQTNPPRPGRVSDESAVEQALDMTGILPLRDRELPTLSGGERQRVSLARVIAQTAPVGKNSVLLLDEPTSSMDIGHAEATLALLRELAAQGAAIVVVLHDLDAAAFYADRLCLLERGRVRLSGPVNTVCRSDVLSAVYGTPVEVLEYAGRLRVGPVREPR